MMFFNGTISSRNSKKITVESIALLLPTVELGTYWQPVLAELKQELEKVILYTGRPWPGFEQSNSQSTGVEVVGKTVRITDKEEKSDYSGGYMLLSPGIINRLLRFRPQVVITSGFSIWTLLTIFLKPLGRWRVVLAWEGSSPSVDFRSSKTRLLLRRIMAMRADNLITNSQAGKSYLTDCLGIRRDKIQVQPYMVPDAKTLLSKADCHTENLDLSSARLTFLYVGRIETRKGLHLLLEACKYLKEAGQEFTLTIVGRGPEQAELESYCKEQGLEGYLNWVGWVAYDSLGAYFRNADVFVFPSLEDTWGMVVLEAMAFGLPIICSTRAGASEMVTENENGYLFDPDSPQPLAKHMRNFIDDSGLVEKMGAASQHLIQPHTPKAAAHFFIEAAQSAFEKNTSVNKTTTS